MTNAQKYKHENIKLAFNTVLIVLAMLLVWSLTIIAVTENHATELRKVQTMERMVQAGINPNVAACAVDKSHCRK